MKRYFIFGYDEYEALGALNDVVASADTIEEMKILIRKSAEKIEVFHGDMRYGEGWGDYDHIEVFDLQERCMVPLNEILP